MELSCLATAIVELPVELPVGGVLTAGSLGVGVCMEGDTLGKIVILRIVGFIFGFVVYLLGF